jgi:hypothetical protein
MKAPLDNAILMLSAKVFAQKLAIIFCLAALAIVFASASCKQAPSKDAPNKTASPPKDTLEQKFNLLGLHVGMKLSDVKPILAKTMVGGIGVVEDKLSDGFLPDLTCRSKDGLMSVLVIPDKRKKKVAMINISAVSEASVIAASSAGSVASETSAKATKVHGTYTDTGQVFLGWSNEDVINKLGPSEPGLGSDNQGHTRMLYYSNKDLTISIIVMDGIVCGYHIDAKEKS